VGIKKGGQLPKMVDLSEINLNSKALHLVELEAHVRGVQLQRQRMQRLEASAKGGLEAMVNPANRGPQVYCIGC
jgi:hypothetical protein